MHEKILKLASAMVSPTEEEAILLDELCTAAEAELTARLREGVLPEDCGSFPYAAALIAAGDLRLSQGSGEIRGFTAGDISVQLHESGREDAASPRRQAAALLSRFLRDDSFAFRGVRG